jgi:uncharacterized protein
VYNLCLFPSICATLIPVILALNSTIDPGCTRDNPQIDDLLLLIPGMDLRDRLKAMGVRPRVMGATSAPPSDEVGVPASGALSQPVGSAQPLSPNSFFSAEGYRPLRSSQAAIDKALPGRWHDTDDGPCFYAERHYPVTQARGPVLLGALLQSHPTILCDAGRVSRLQNIPVGKMLFLDTETTGLSGGTGTYVFMVGVAFFSERGDELVLRQYFLSDVSAERSFLRALNDLFAGFEAVVTFNGKSFDWPLLETRYITSRLRCVLRDPPHLDMLHLSRRLWRDRLESCSLEMLESHVLGVHRGFDVPGWRIPSLYFQYLRAGHAGYVLPVFEHNEHDLLTLVALTAHVSRILDQPEEVDLQAAEWFGLGKMYEDLGKYTKSLHAYEHGLALRPSDTLRAATLRRLSYLYKYLQQREEAVVIWAQLAQEGTHLMFPYLELAKHYEHRAKDYLAAIEYTLMAQTRASNVVERAELEHRLKRVQVKATRASAIESSQ